MNALYATYLARGLTSGLWKIGRTRNVPSRLTTLALVEPLELRAVVPGPRALEPTLHKRFAALLALDVGRGREWFRDDGSIASFVASLPDVLRGSVAFQHDPPPRSPREPAPRFANGDRDYGTLHRRYSKAATHGGAHGAGQRRSTCALCVARAAWETRFAARWTVWASNPFLFPPGVPVVVRPAMCRFLPASAHASQLPRACTSGGR